MINPTHRGPTLATAARVRELIRTAGDRQDILGLLDAILYDWEPRLAALVPPLPAVDSPKAVEAVQAPSGLVFGDEAFEIHRKAKGKRR